MNEDEFLILQEEMDFDELVESLLFDSSDNDDETIENDRLANKRRAFKDANDRLISHYFSGRESLYSEADFERRFRMPRAVFQRIHDALMGVEPFTHKKDATNKLGIYPLVKLVACIRYIAYGDAYDSQDENFQLSASALRLLCGSFCKLIVREFGSQYLNRAPNAQERKSISRAMARKGFPGCLGSWDCKHFNWKNCPMRLAGHHKGHAEGGKKTLILEAIADHRRYIWQVNFGDPGTLNDLNVLDRSSIVGAMLSGTFQIGTEPYSINGKERDWMYFLVDGIYPPWSIFVTTYSNPTDPKKKKFQQHQEMVRKDVECAFGVIISRFHILDRPIRQWFLEDIKDLLNCCVILHNMIVEHRAGSLEEDIVDGAPAPSFPLFGRRQITQQEAVNDGIDIWAARVSAMSTAMESSYEHGMLKKDLVEHINSFSTRS